MRIPSLAAIPAIMLVCALCNADEATYYSQELCKSIDKEKTASEVRLSLSLYARKLQDMQVLAKSAKDDNYFLADCIAKRVEICGRLASYLEKMLKSSEADALLYARQGSLEIKELLKYFDEMKERYAFLKANPAVRTISVKTFGAIGDGVHDDAPAIAKAMEEAKKCGGRVKVIIPAGKYLLGERWTQKPRPEGVREWKPLHLKTEEAFKKNCLPLEGASDITIEGEKGTILLGADPTKGIFLFQNCKFLTVRNIAFDYAQLPMTQGVIIAVDEERGSADLKIDEGYPAPDLDYFLSAHGFRATVHDPVSGRQIFEGSDKWIKSVKDCGNGVFTINFSRATSNPMLKGIEPGRKLAIIARINFVAANVVGNRDCSHLTFDGLTVHSTPGGSFGGRHSSASNIVNCAIKSPEGARRVMCSDADSCMVDSPLIGPYVANNQFEYIGDDLSNNCVAGSDLADLSSDGLSFVTNTMKFTPGYPVSIVDNIDGTIKAESVVVSVSMPDNPWLSTVRVESPLSGVSMKALGQQRQTPAQRYEIFTGAKKDESKKPDRIVNRLCHGSGSIVSGNVFRYGRNGGIFSRVSNAIIENNTVEDIKGCGLQISVLLNVWTELNAAHTVVVRNNSFRNNGTGMTILYLLSNGLSQTITPLRDIAIENNLFKDTGDTFISNCQDVRITGNRFESRTPLKLGLARGVEISGNTFDLPADKAIVYEGGKASAVKIDSNTYAK